MCVREREKEGERGREGRLASRRLPGGAAVGAYFFLQLLLCPMQCKVPAAVLYRLICNNTKWRLKSSLV